MKRNIRLMNLALAVVIGLGLTSVLLAQAGKGGPQAPAAGAPATTGWYCPCAMMQNANYPGPVTRGSNVPARPYCPYWNATMNTQTGAVAPARPYCPYWNATTNAQTSAVAPGGWGRGLGRGRFAPGTGPFCPFNPYNNPASGTATGNMPTGDAPAQSSPAPAAK
jgi:hypothetical protein